MNFDLVLLSLFSDVSQYPKLTYSLQEVSLIQQQHTNYVMSLHQQLKIVGKLGDPDDCPKVVNGLLVLLGGEALETLVN